MDPSLNTPLIGAIVTNALSTDGEGLRLCRTLTHTMHDCASYHLFYSVHILSTKKFAATLNVVRSTSIAAYITALTIGSTTRLPAHKPSTPLPRVHYGVLFEILELLPNLKTLKIGIVEPQAVFRLPSPDVGPGHPSPSYATVLSNEAVQADLSAQSLWQSIRVVVPPSSAWAGAAQAGIILGHSTAYANLIRLNESELPENLAGVLAAGSSVMAFYGGTVDAFSAFGRLVLPSMDRVLRSLTISWTVAHALRHNSEMIKAVRTGISACTQVEHLTLGLFLGSTAAVSLEDQWSATLSFLGAANRATLRTFTLVVTVFEDKALAKYLAAFETLEWTQAARFLHAGRSPRFEAVALKVVGARQEVAERIKWAMELGLGHELPVRRSRDSCFRLFLTMWLPRGLLQKL